jgi:hypothetical protein
MNNKVNIRVFIVTMSGSRLWSRMRHQEPGVAMFLFNRSGLAVVLALVVAALPVFIQYF